MAKIKDVDLDLPVEFSPYQKKDCLIDWIENTEVFIMQPEDAKSFISELNENGLLELIEESLQSLAQRNDGTQLLTAMPYLSEVKAVFSKLSSVPNELLSLLAEWEVLGCNIVDISFVDNLKRWQKESEFDFLSQDTRSEPCCHCEKPYNQCSCNYENNEVTK